MMNNKEKRKYMTDLVVFQTHPFLSELETRRDFLKLTPVILYKYRAFDKYAFDMIDNNYVYLAPVKGLDDPFDCLSDFAMKDFYNEKTHRITPKAIDFIINLVCPNGIKGWTNEELRKLAIQCIDENGIDYNKVPKIVYSNGLIRREEVEPLFVVLNTFNENFENILNNSKLDGFAETAMFSGEKVGICSLSENRDNKVMWSLYGNKYEGYCIEYDIPKHEKVIPNLYPVVYTKKSNNKFIEKLLEYAMGAMLRAVSNGHLSGNIGATMELFCSKDTDWSYQDEWRLIANAGGHFPYLKIKSIYLGFKVNKTNEIRMKRYAKKYGFSLFKMNPPNGKKKIKYSKVI